MFYNVNITLISNPDKRGKGKESHRPVALLKAGMKFLDKIPELEHSSAWK